MLPTVANDILHSKPEVVSLQQVEDELSALRKVQAAAGTAGAPLLRACTLTLAIFCDPSEDPEDLEGLIAQVVSSNPARVITIAQPQPQAEPSLETRISAYQIRDSQTPRLVGEEIAFYPRGGRYGVLPSAVLSLRVSGLPFVLYWRGQPDLDDRLFHALVGECDQIFFDSQHFTARAERVNNTIVRLRIEYPTVSFGDVNWQRIRPWREFVAQFFDHPGNMCFLDLLTKVEIEFSVGMGGNQSAAVLLMAWLASSLGWRVVHGSYEREGLVRRARFLRRSYEDGSDVEIEVLIHVREQPDCMPGELTGVRLEAVGQWPATFEIKRAVGGFVDIKESTGQSVRERCATLALPEDSGVISAELDAPRRDRNYHRALEILDALTTQMTA